MDIFKDGKEYPLTDSDQQALMARYPDLRAGKRLRMIYDTALAIEVDGETDTGQAFKQHIFPKHRVKMQFKVVDAETRKTHTWIFQRNIEATSYDAGTQRYTVQPERVSFINGKGFDPVKHFALIWFIDQFVPQLQGGKKASKRVGTAVWKFENLQLEAETSVADQVAFATAITRIHEMGKTELNKLYKDIFDVTPAPTLTEAMKAKALIDCLKRPDLKAKIIEKTDDGTMALRKQVVQAVEDRVIETDGQGKNVIIRETQEVICPGSADDTSVIVKFLLKNDKMLKKVTDAIAELEKAEAAA